MADSFCRFVCLSASMYLSWSNSCPHQLLPQSYYTSNRFKAKHEFSFIIKKFTFTKESDDDMHEYGVLYCKMIDPAVAKSTIPIFKVEQHYPSFFKDEVSVPMSLLLLDYLTICLILFNKRNTI